MREDWVEVNLDKICKIQTGKYDANHAVQSGKYRFYTCAYNFSRCNTNRFSGESLVLPGNGANVGEVFYYNGDFDAYQRTYVINEIEILPKFLYYHFQRNWKRINIDKQFGTATNFIKIGNFLNYNVSFPSLVEQRAIVKKLESLLSSLDAGIADLKKAQQQLKIYRQAVLKKAFEGELTKYNLSDYLIKIEAGKSFKCKETTPSVDEVGILKISAVTWGEFNELESKTVEDLTKININYFVNPGDFLMSRANTLELVGNSVIVNNISRKLMLSDKTLRLKFTSEIIPKYVLYFLSSKDGKGQIMSLSTGNQESMRNISQSGINKIKIPVPQSIEQQKEIVKQVESRLSVCDSIEQNIKEGLEKAEALRQSILKKAFDGNLLTAQELAACKKDADYEPASVLLERIKADQNQTKNKKK